MSGTDLVLFGAKTGNSFRAAIGLFEAGLPFRAQRVDFSLGEHLRVGPDGKVPVLIGGIRSGAPEFILTQSNAILSYADKRRPGHLMPLHGDPLRTTVLEAYFYFVTDVIAVSGAAFGLRKQGHSDAAQVLANQYMDAIVRSERFLGSTGYMGGAAFSIADIAGFTVTNAFSDAIAWDRLPKLRAWFELVKNRPAVQSGLAAFD